MDRTGALSGLPGRLRCTLTRNDCELPGTGDRLMSHTSAHQDTRLLPRPHWALGRVLGVIVTASVVVICLSPFANWDADTSLRLRLARFVDPSAFLEEPASESFEHLGSMLVLGMALFALDRRNGVRKRIAHSMLMGVAVCTLIETYQVLLPSPHEGQIDDWTINVLGSTAGVFIAFLLRRLGALILSWYGRLERRVLLAILTTVALLWLVTLLAPPILPVPLDDWDRTYPLLVGNERTRDRSWLGEIRYLAFYNEALAPTEVADRLEISALDDANGRENAAGLLTYWDFTRGPVDGLRPGGPAETPAFVIDDPGACVWSSTAGLVIERPTTISTVKPPIELINAIAATGRFSVEVIFRTADLDQSGLGRIVSMSDDPYLRNFMIGQINRGLQVRVRNEVAGINGFYPKLDGAEPILDLGVQHVIVTYDGRHTRLYSQDRSKPISVVYERPSKLLVLGDGIAVQFTGAFLFVLPLGAALGGLVDRRHPLVAGASAYALIEAGWLIRLLVTGYHPTLTVTVLIACVALGSSILFDRLCHADRQASPA